MLSIQQGLQEEGVAVPMTKLCRWFGVARRTVYYHQTRQPARIRPELAEPIKQLIEQEPSFGYRTVAALLGMNKNTVQRIFQLKGWQVRKRPMAGVHGYRHCPRWPQRRTSAGQPICAVSGAARTAG